MENKKIIGISIVSICAIAFLILFGFATKWYVPVAIVAIILFIMILFKGLELMDNDD